MQNQQKRVKWSRGETAEALEERTDTGITQASVSFMENCIPDIYGNVSRRPGLKLIPVGWSSSQIFPGFAHDKYLQVFPFYITETDYILIGVHYNFPTEMMRVKDGVIVYQKMLSSDDLFPKTSVSYGGSDVYRPVSYAQQNNYMLIADGHNVYKLSFTFSNLSDEFFPSIELWKFSAGWYAPTGTQTKKVDSVDITGMSFASNTIKSYSWTEADGSTSVGSWISTGIAATNYHGDWTGTTTTYYCGYNYDGKLLIHTSQSVFQTIRMTWTMTNGTTYTSGQTVATWQGTGLLPGHGKVVLYLNGNKSYFVASIWGGISSGNQTTPGYDVSEKMTNDIPAIQEAIPNGSIVQFPNNGAYMRVEGYTSDTTNLMMYGELLTPVADSNTTDTMVGVEYDFKSLAPEAWDFSGSNFPHPKKLVFCDQRLWAGAWAYSATDEYALTIGSQIARYNDLKNNYNQENEPITLDILTQYKERILHLVDYNGLKIMTDSYEYAYVDGGAKKQSANGSFEYCEPLIFDSLCLYIDSTGCQVKAMQYEFQNNVFDSTTINQFAPHDLVWYPWAMAQYEDKVNNTGKYLFLLNREDGQARLAVCNFVPTNQANIWNRWSMPNISITYLPNPRTTSMIHSVVNLKNGALFMLVMAKGNTGYGSILPAMIDFNAHADCENVIYTEDDVNYYCPLYDSVTGYWVTVPNTQVAVYSDGVFQFLTTTTSTGAITADISQLTNVTVGLPINAKVISHPIDVGGKTKSIKKRIAKTVLSVHDTESGAITINSKTGYMNPQKDKINFYGVTGMKDEIKYTLTNNNGAMFHLESLLMNIEYGTLIS
jgi:hypothetical protein